ncbi:unnamed protein product [Cuscuta epithymum]|uniref:Peptidase C1A papain C-terminal domain-containing protein n=2 Tax=Cuscuta epithymum TaxID=186058 RepID=A0AAV0D8E9_9ASTE|nr:unnamed protein product [Cuscuta epithymum]
MHDAGSCWAFSAVAAVETLLWLKINHRLVNLSEQVILNCGVAFSSSGCTGDQFSVAFDVVQQIGIPSDEFFPYLGGSKGSCDLKTIAAVGYKIGGYTEIQGSPRERAVLDVVRNQPVSVSINGGTHNFQHYKGDIFDDPSCSASPEDQNHGVTIVGFGTSNNGKKYWKVKNSWGKTWGEDGYMRIARDQGRCGIATEAYYPNGPI